MPKPSRAAYPCQRAAFPLASGFVVWLAAVIGTRVFWRSARHYFGRHRWGLTTVCAGLAMLGAAFALSQIPISVARADLDLSHAPLGTAKGIHPGRVVWVHAPDATDWPGYESPTPWWLGRHTDLAVAEEMTAAAILSLTGESDRAAAWASLFRHFNREHGRGDIGYGRGEKIAIKINLTACNARGNQADEDYTKLPEIRNRIDNSPQLLLALLRELIYVGGVEPADISLADPTGLFANHLWNAIHPEFPEVRCVDNRGTPGSGRVRAEFSSTRVYWSTPAADGKLPDYLPVTFAEADYIINYALLKGHDAGISVCAKNHYGSLLRCPDRYLRDQGYADYYDLHNELPSVAKGMGRYRPQVDLMGHRELGGKTLLYLIDGLFGGYYWEGRPYPWKMPPFGDGEKADWPNSLFASQDPVAIDSVAFDFLLAEWPGVVTGGTGAPGSLEGGAEDYLHEAALAGRSPSGTSYDPEGDGVPLSSLGVHEHWNNPVDKQYSQDRGLGTGIELVRLSVGRPEPRLDVRRRPDHTVLSWRASLDGYRVEYATELSSDSGWRPLEGAPTFKQALNVLTNATSDPRRFYRLIR